MDNRHARQTYTHITMPTKHTHTQARLDYLTAKGEWGQAASMLPRLLKERMPLWERWLVVFAQV